MSWCEIAVAIADFVRRGGPKQVPPKRKVAHFREGRMFFLSLAHSSH
jgi:hypothetical protein